jgi:UPF0755 protein
VSLEGFLFPDTYYVSEKSTTKDIVEILLTGYENKFLNYYEKNKSKTTYSLYELTTLASIVEREARNDIERKNISNIFIKRLAGKMQGVKLLQADATLLYSKKDWKYSLSQKDKDSNDPYNTYKFTGLTPTPICNPGESSLKSTIDYIENNYFYHRYEELCSGK